MKNSIIVISGGIDSVTMLYEYKNDIAMGISFDYGSKHNEKEIPFAKYHCNKLGIRHIVIDLDFMGKYFNSSLLKGGDDIPDGNYAEDNMKSTVVPFRNGIMLAIAAGVAESNRLKKIMIANHFGDHAIYPDCTKAFINAMNMAVNNGTYANIEIFAPYTDITKSEIVSRGTKLGIDYTMTWSCYKGGDVHCGNCGTCHERKEAFRQANVHDFTEYEQ